MSAVRFVMVSVGIWSSTALVEDGTVWIWGGMPAPLFSPEPTMLNVEAFGGSRAVMVSCGFIHTMVLTEDGRLWTFGLGEDGQLGHGIEETVKATPTLILSFSKETKIVMVAAGACHSMALTAEGDVYTWGSAKHGVLGHHHVEGDPFTLMKSVPTKIDRACFAGSSVVIMAAGCLHNAAVTEDGRVFTWGHGGNGKLGLGDIETKVSPTPLSLDVFGGSLVRMMTCSNKHTMAVTEEGGLWSWGVSLFPDTPDLLVPTLVQQKHFEGAKIVTATACDHVSMAVTEEGTLYSWGYNKCTSDMPSRLGHVNCDRIPVPMRLSPHFCMDGARVGRYHRLHPLHAIAFAMGMHSRLGSGRSADINQPHVGSLVNILDDNLVKMILEASRSFPEGEGVKLHHVVRLSGVWFD